MSAVSLHTQEWTKSNFNSFIVPKYINAPFTTIQNRSQVLDASNMLQAVMGVERIPFKGINLLQKEFGSNGEPVYELESKDARVRFIGAWLSSPGTHGIETRVNVIGDSIEIVFYGTGLNLLTRTDTTLIGGLISIDGGADTTLNQPAISGVLINRNYNPNVIFNLVSGLSLGTHTVKYKLASSVLVFDGVEILNQSSALTIPSGQAFIGNKKESLAVPSNSAFNAGFVGTKGGRVSKYLKDGIISQVIRECASTPSYLASANHADEEVVRRVNYRDFGSGISNDFSTLAASVISVAFTLDDGTTTLVGSQVRDGGTVNGLTTVSPYASGAHLTLTFVGTGLDIVIGASLTTFDNHSLIIDGVSQGNLTLPTDAAIHTLKICSGLPYGTHTVKITRTSFVNSSTGFGDFIIYQPKKPVLPIGAIEIADYNVMADKVNGSSSGIISQGVLRKLATREFTYVGTWGFSGIDVGFADGWNLLTNTAGGFFEYSFFGDSIEHCAYFSGAAINWTYSIDGSTNLTAFSPTIVSAATGVSIVASTGVMSGTPSVSAYQSKVIFNNLGLGWHKIKITYNSGALPLYADAFDIHCPIHINHPSLKVGSLSLMDNANIQAILTPPTLGLDQVRKYDFGYNQTWYTLTSVRASNIIYYNNTDKPIMVSINGTNGGNMDIYVNGLKVTTVIANSTNVHPTGCAIVPAGASYYTPNSFLIWTELR